MARRFFRSITIGIIVFAFAVLIGYLSYVLTYRYQTDHIRENMHTASTAQTATARTAQPSPADHYLARLENRDIAIYMVSDGQETFLYRLHVYTGDLPSEDLVRLKEGIVLHSKQELTALEEDYTS